MPVASRRLLQQRLVGEPFPDAARAVGWLTAVQAQDFAGAKWGVGQRVAGATEAVIDAAFQKGELLRTHVLRPTWHFVLPSDIRWLLSLTAARVHRANGSMYRKLELDAATFRRSEKLIAAALARDGALTRAELQSTLERARIEASGLRLGYLLMHAELEAVICSGPRRGKQFTYALLDERAPRARALGRDAALARLALGYFQSHGPATVHDFAWWAGLTLADARRGLSQVETKLAAEELDGTSYWSARSATAVKPRGKSLRLLPNYDEFVIAYKDYGPSFDPELLTRRVGKREEVLANHLVVADGKVIGGWRRLLEKKGVALEVTLLVHLDASGERRLRVEAERFGRYLGLPVSLRRL